MGRSLVKAFFLFFIMSFLFFLSGCQSEQLHSIHYHSGKSVGMDMKQSFITDSSIVSYETSMDEFRFVVGWASNDEILIVESNGERDVIFSYNIENGKRIDRFFSDHPIISASISPTRKYILVHTSPLPYEASIHIYRLDTDELVFEQNLESSEIDYEWNWDREENVLLVTFFEDWTFAPYILHIEEESVESVELPHPFVCWFDEQSWISINWDFDIPSVTAPLAIFEQNRTEVIVQGKEFYYLDRLGDFFFTMGVDTTDEGESEITFFDKQLQPTFTFHIPHLSTFSGWQIPHYDYIDETKTFMIIEPIESGEADIYQGGFQLVKRNLASGEETVILDSVDNAPLSCSPDGNYCLTGNFLEKLIDINTGELTDLILFQ
ncbi:hypothetical protein [Fervidibacillus albus]|uniref:YqgU-like 6-bladed beta-propeller domain-containing protein n=1 Tax=Fervidibacillus albus TaxID=2980026 RepID=A0A9E8LVF3_9BACI|nr:hypothetical protein [Fervidibacillus albus]WAA10423.1 hypothetical protein OE104_03575 [Fervidibacillus albus]